MTQIVLHAAPKPPSQIAGRFKNNIKGNVSDEFNSKINFGKWTYRKAINRADRKVSTGASFVRTVNGYLSVSAKKSSQSGGGLCGLNPSRFGFYVTRWRFIGDLNASGRTVFHPAIWCHKKNQGVNSREVKTDSNWLEIDMIEYENTTPGSWSGDMPVKINNKAQKRDNIRPVCVKKGTRLDLRPWKVIGLEYMPTYCRMWERKNGKWKIIGQRVSIIPDGQISTPTLTTPTSFPRSCADKVYWIFSNIWIKYANNNAANGDTWLHMDYFAHYPKK